ncbi:hypothetical protein Hanom_Chr15g01376291 [Helianthus anomalus]
MGPNCFDTVKRNQESVKRHQFLGKFKLEKHWKFGPVFVGNGVKPVIEIENLVTDDEGTDSDTELMESVQAELPIRELSVMNSKDLAALIESLKGSFGNPPHVVDHTLEEEVQYDTTEDTDLVSRKKQRVEPEPSVVEHVSPTAETDPTIQTEPEVATTTAPENVIPDFFEMSFLETATRSEPEVQVVYVLMLVEVPVVMKFIEQSDSDDDMDVDVVKLQKRVIVLEQDSLLKYAQITSLQDQVFNKDQTINQLQNDLENKFGREFVDENDDPMNVEQRNQTAEERFVADAKREAALNKYLETEQPKKRKAPQRKQSNKQMLIMKNQDVNPLDENFQPKDPTYTSDCYVMELGKCQYDKVGKP